MRKIPPTTLLACALRISLALFVLCFCVSGCASYPGKDLPVYTYTDLAPAPEDKMCVVVSYTGSKRDREIIDSTIAMFEKSGYFLKAPERCTPNESKNKNKLTMNFRYDLKAGNFVVGLISAFICGATLTIIPAYSRDDYMLTMQLRREDQLVKEYVYREHMDTWTHLSLLFKISDHTPRATTYEIRERMIMNFLYDYSRDVQQGKLIAIGQ